MVLAKGHMQRRQKELKSGAEVELGCAGNFLLCFLKGLGMALMGYL